MGQKPRTEAKSVFIAVLLSRSEGESSNFLVLDGKGNTTFKSRAAVDKAVAADMRNYAKSEREAGYRCRIVSNHIEWTGSDEEALDREAKWYVYEIGLDKPV